MCTTMDSWCRSLPDALSGALFVVEVARAGLDGVAKQGGYLLGAEVELFGDGQEVFGEVTAEIRRVI